MRLRTVYCTDGVQMNQRTVNGEHPRARCMRILYQAPRHCLEIINGERVNERDTDQLTERPTNGGEQVAIETVFGVSRVEKYYIISHGTCLGDEARSQPLHAEAPHALPPFFNTPPLAAPVMAARKLQSTSRNLNFFEAIKS